MWLCKRAHSTRQNTTPSLVLAVSHPELACRISLTLVEDWTTMADRKRPKPKRDGPGRPPKAKHPKVEAATAIVRDELMEWIANPNTRRDISTLLTRWTGLASNHVHARFPIRSPRPLTGQPCSLADDFTCRSRYIVDLRKQLLGRQRSRDARTASNKEEQCPSELEGSKEDRLAYLLEHAQMLVHSFPTTCTALPLPLGESTRSQHRAAA